MKKRELPSLTFVLARRGMTLAAWLAEEGVTDAARVGELCRARGCEPPSDQSLQAALDAGRTPTMQKNSVNSLLTDVSRVSSVGPVRRPKKGRGSEDQVGQVNVEVSTVRLEQAAHVVAISAEDQAEGLTDVLLQAAGCIHQTAGRDDTVA